jgi:hypothetical protein
MSRLKTLSVLAGIIASLAISVTPAYAVFKSKNGSTQGTGHAILSGSFKYASQGTVECEPKTIEAKWQIQTAGQIKEHQINGKQEPTTEGPHLNIQIKNWGTCKAIISGSTLPANVKPCELQLVQTAKGVLTATGGVVTPCIVKAGEPTKPTCEIQIPAGIETAAESGVGINVGLKENTLKNTAAGLLGKTNITGGGQGQLAGEGIYAESLAGHSLCPLKPVTEEATLSGLEVEAEGVEEV